MYHTWFPSGVKGLPPAALLLLASSTSLYAPSSEGSLNPSADSWGTKASPSPKCRPSRHWKHAVIPLSLLYVMLFSSSSLLDLKFQGHFLITSSTWKLLVAEGGNWWKGQQTLVVYPSK